MVATSKWLLADEALSGTRVQVYVGPSSTRPYSANSLPKDRGHFSGSSSRRSSSRCLLRHGVDFEARCLLATSSLHNSAPSAQTPIQRHKA